MPKTYNIIAVRMESTDYNTLREIVDAKFRKAKSVSALVKLAILREIDEYQNRPMSDRDRQLAEARAILAKMKASENPDAE